VSQLSLAELVTAARRTVNDTGSGRNALIRDEQLGGIDGIKKRFGLLYYPIVTSTIELRLNGVLLATPANYSVDETTGIVTMVTAPSDGPPMDVLEATYRFLWFADEDFHEFIAEAAVSAGFPQAGATATARATLVAENYPDGMLDALLAFVGYHFNVRRADEHAHRFSSSAGGQSVNTDVVTKNFRELSKQFWDMGVTMRDDFFRRRGAREAPSVAVGGYVPTISPSGPFGSPRR
jgi:hypothetical protein